MNAYLNHITIDFRVGVRNKVLLLLNYLLPLGFYLMMGFVMLPINPGFRDMLIPSMIVFAMLSAMLLGIPDPLVTFREMGVFRSYKINGVPVASILSIPAITTTLHAVIVSLIITLTAPLLFKAPLPLNWGYFILAVALSAFSMAGIGVLIGVISPSSNLTVLFTQLIYLPSMILGGITLPTNLLPETMQKIAHIFPTTHVMNLFQSLAYGQTTPIPALVSVIVLAAGGVLGFGLALFLFRWDRKNTPWRANPFVALLALLPYIVSIFIG